MKPPYTEDDYAHDIGAGEYENGRCPYCNQTFDLRPTEKQSFSLLDHVCECRRKVDDAIDKELNPVMQKENVSDAKTLADLERESNSRICMYCNEQIPVSAYHKHLKACLIKENDNIEKQIADMDKRLDEMKKEE